MFSGSELRLRGLTEKYINNNKVPYSNGRYIFPEQAPHRRLRFPQTYLTSHYPTLTLPVLTLGIMHAVYARKFSGTLYGLKQCVEACFLFFALS